MNDDRLNVRVGVFVVVALIACVLAVLGLEGRHLRPGIRVHVKMQRAGTLKEGMQVRVSGRVIGAIDRIRLVPAREEERAPDATPDERSLVILDLYIDKRSRWLVRENSEFFVNQPGVLGEAYLEVGAPRGDPGPVLGDGATVRGIDPPRIDRLLRVSYENLVNATELLREGIPETRELVANLDELGRTLDAINAEPGVATASWESTWNLFREGRALSAWAEDSGASRARFSATQARLSAFAARAQADLAIIGPKLDAFTGELERLSRTVDPARFAELAAVLDEARALQARLLATTATAQAIVTALDRGEGTLGAFLHDAEIADDIKAMTKVMKSQPWRAAGHRKNKPGNDPIVP